MSRADMTTDSERTSGRAAAASEPNRLLKKSCFEKLTFEIIGFFA
jgi:hypothetical protein